MLDCTEPTFTVVVAFVRVLTGTGTSEPEAMVAFLLLLVKTVGREMILNLPVDSSKCTMAAKASPAATLTLVPLVAVLRILLKSMILEGSITAVAGMPGLLSPNTPLLVEMPTNLLWYFAK